MHHNALMQAIYKQSKNVLPEPQSLHIPSHIKIRENVRQDR